VEIGGEPSGSGFVVARNLIVTSYHVVQDFDKGDKGNLLAKVSSDISVRFSSGVTAPAVPVWPTDVPQRQKCVGKDYIFLRIDRETPKPLPLGYFKNSAEGASIYIAGYPFGVNQPIVSRGMLSTKWQAPGYHGVGGKRWVAWLDVTMNAGNSGGPVILLGDTSGEDTVIGIATFSLNPFAQRAEKLAEFARQTQKRGSVSLMGINIGAFAELVGRALRANSLGIGGCVAIEYAAEDLK